MAAEDGSPEPGEEDTKPVQDAPTETPPINPSEVQNASDEDEDDDSTEGEEDEDEEDEEPRLKYAMLTRNLSSLYRNGDATSSCLVSGDKMARCRLLSMCYAN